MLSQKLQPISPEELEGTTSFDGKTLKKTEDHAGVQSMLAVGAAGINIKSIGQRWMVGIGKELTEASIMNIEEVLECNAWPVQAPSSFSPSKRTFLGVLIDCTAFISFLKAQQSPNNLHFRNWKLDIRGNPVFNPQMDDFSFRLGDTPILDDFKTTRRRNDDACWRKKLNWEPAQVSNALTDELDLPVTITNAEDKSLERELIDDMPNVLMDGEQDACLAAKDW
jgi:hypothetical protein